jgi:nudix-type nucleoside diphosphatase (YffH/AdpP family)
VGISNRVRIRKEELLSKDWAVLTKTTYDFQRSDGQWQTQTRESYDRGDGCTLLLYNLKQRTIVLIKQFRFPIFKAGYDDLFIEAPAGVLDAETPEIRIKAEVEEETGYVVQSVRKIFESYMSPGSVTEKLHFFVAEYQSGQKRTVGGGIAAEGEDIEVLELPIATAAKMIEQGKILDAKTIMLIQYAQISIFPIPAP